MNMPQNDSDFENNKETIDLNEFLNKINKVVFFITLFFACWMFAITKNGADLDLWHRLAVGKIFSQVGNVIYHDIFAYFPTKPLWVDHEWLSGVVFYNLGHYFGDWGIVALKILGIFSIILLTYKSQKLIYPQDKKLRISYYLVTIISIIIGFYATLRCQIFTYLFFTLWIYILEQVRRGNNRLLWIFPAITLIWANMHAGFIAGLGLIGFYGAGEFLNKKPFAKYFGIIAACLAVTLLNPYGIKYWPYLIEATTMPRPFIKEWMHLNPFQSFYTVLGTKILFLMIFPGIIFSIYKYFSNKKIQNENKPDWVEIIALCVTFYLSIRHFRHVVFFSIILSIFGYRYFVEFAEYIYTKFKIRERLLKITPEKIHEYIYFMKLSFVYSCLLTIMYLVISQTTHAITLEFFPTKAIEFIKRNKLEGNLLLPFNWGSYAMWKLYPQNFVAMDGRYEECYTNEAYMDNSIITFRNKKWDKSNWQKTFDKYHHDILLIEVINKKVLDAIEETNKWKMVYKDREAVIFLPKSFPEKKWITPNQDENYYIKTKYENNINF